MKIISLVESTVEETAGLPDGSEGLDLQSSLRIMMCVLIIMILIPVRTDSCTRSPFCRQMFFCLVM